MWLHVTTNLCTHIRHKQILGYLQYSCAVLFWIVRELFCRNLVRLSLTMFNYCRAKPLTKAEPIGRPGSKINDSFVTFRSGTQMLKINKRFSQWVYSSWISCRSITRIHSDHHDLGGVCAACCHDSHPGGQSVLIPSVSLVISRKAWLSSCTAAVVFEWGQSSKKIGWGFADIMMSLFNPWIHFSSSALE